MQDYLDGKGKNRVALVKSLICSRVERGAREALNKRSLRNAIKVDQNCKLIFVIYISYTKSLKIA